MSLAASSLKRYEGMLKKIVEAFGETYYQTPQAVSDWVEKNYPNVQTRNSYYSALKHYAKNDIERNVYKAKSAALKPQKDKAEKSQTLPQARLEKLLKWDELQEAYRKARADLNFDFDKFLLIALYTQIAPLRADFAGMEYITSLEDVKEGKNYCFLGSTELNTTPSQCKSRVKIVPACFILQDYKTAKKYGKVSIPIPDNLLASLKKHWNGGGFGGNRYVFKGTSNALCKAVTRAFEDVTGKPTTIGLIRHSRITALYATNPSIVEKEALAALMLHAPGEGERYRVL